MKGFFRTTHFLLQFLLIVLFTVNAQAQINGIGPSGQIAQAQTGFQFTEGPAADLLGNIYFTDVQRNRIHRIDTAGQLTTFLENTQGMNGLMFDPRGRLIGCQSAAGRIVAIDAATKAITEITSQFEGARFNSPNDLVVDRAGNIYFTDRNGNGVYFIATDNSVKKIISTLSLPNGILLSIDEKTLYVLHGSPNMMVYPISAPGQLGAPRTFALQGNGGGDGMTIDTQGTLYITRPGSNAIQVLTPSGQSLGTIPFSEAPSNCVFGGADMKTLFVTARTSVYTARMISVGHRFASPVASVSAASFSGSSLGQGVAAAVVLRIKADGAQSYEPVARFEPSLNRFVPVPIDLGAESDQLFLLLYGTGIRGRGSLASVGVLVGGVAAQVDYAGAQGDFVGLDQVNVRLPRILSGRGEMELTLTADNGTSNTVRINIK